MSEENSGPLRVSQLEDVAGKADVRSSVRFRSPAIFVHDTQNCTEPVTPIL
jgi:hypothetical protein